MYYLLVPEDKLIIWSDGKRQHQVQLIAGELITRRELYKRVPLQGIGRAYASHWVQMKKTDTHWFFGARFPNIDDNGQFIKGTPVSYHEVCRHN